MRRSRRVCLTSTTRRTGLKSGRSTLPLTPHWLEDREDSRPGEAAAELPLLPLYSTPLFYPLSLYPLTLLLPLFLRLVSTGLVALTNVFLTLKPKSCTRWL
ncbi:hypothetical protein PGIGA_G00060190 [Pangasianodon gigas]|uniref:Uncharacterized protein n=1 Tax=Pangasianodon gigas TaxID=30993 RepID=A0ACC5X520_PANGG|nr:hypothetical protein [Pangasianodon gigas]